MLDIKAIGYELRTLSCYGAQEFFRAFVDERDVAKVHNARASFAGSG